MKTILFLLISFIATNVYSQDYFAIVKQNDDVTYNYPETAKFTLTDDKGNATLLKKDDAIDVTGDYTLSISVPWSTEPEIIKSNGGRLEIFILPNKYKNEKKEYYSQTKVETKKKQENHDAKPYLESKIIRRNTEDGPYELLAIFSNGLTFKFYDKVARAWYDGEEVKVTNHYLVESPEGLLKLSFDPSDGEFWYVFDTSSKK